MWSINYTAPAASRTSKESHLFCFVLFFYNTAFVSWHKRKFRKFCLSVIFSVAWFPWTCICSLAFSWETQKELLDNWFDKHRFSWCDYSGQKIFRTSHRYDISDSVISYFLPHFYVMTVGLVYETNVHHSSQGTFVLHYQIVAFWAKEKVCIVQKDFCLQKQKFFWRSFFHLPEW